MKKNKCIHNRIRCNDCRVSKSAFYRRWYHIRSRCVHKWDKDYERYGAKGIKFLWDDFYHFKEDMYQSFLQHVKIHGEKNTTIERLDNSKSYCKENCIWATKDIQALNKNSSRLLTIKGETKNIAQWAREIGCSRQALRYRVEKRMPIDEILSTPFNHGNRYDTKTLRPSKKNHR